MKWFSLLALISTVAFAQKNAEFRVLDKKSLSGEQGWDYLAVDERAHRLYMTRGNRVDVVNADTFQSIGEINELDGAHGIAFAPEFKRGYATSGRSSTVVVFETETLKTVDRIKVGDNPDAVVYEEKTKRIFAFNGKSGSASVIDAATGKVIGGIALGGKPEFAVSDGKGTVFDNIEDKNEIVAISAKSMKVTHRYSLSPCESPSGLAMDRKGRRLYAACDNRLLAVINADSGKLIETLPIGDGPDAVGFDPAENLIFVPNGKDGTLTIFHETSPDQYSTVQTLPTQVGARTLAVDANTHRVFAITAQFGPPPSPTPTNPHPRPPIIPGSVVALIVGHSAGN